MNFKCCIFSGLGTPMPLIQFDSKAHRYFHQGTELRPVGTVISQWKPPFDQAKWSAYVADRDGLTVSQVLANWKATSDQALARGTAVHEYVEARLGQAVRPTPVGPARAWETWWTAASQHLTPRATELRVGIPERLVAGTIDSLMWSRKSRQLHVFDWKTGRKFRTTHDRNYKTFLLAPFNDLPDCELSVYSLQVSLYRLILDHYGIGTGPAWIIHVGDQATAHQALDLRHRIAPLL